MSKSKAPRRPYNPKRLINSIKARNVRQADAAHRAAPLDRDTIVVAMAQTHEALAAITAGKGHFGHARLLAMVSNITAQLCEMGLGAEYLAIAQAGRDAILSAAERQIRTGRWGFSGPEIAKVREMLAVRDAQLESEDNTKGLEIEAANAVDLRIAQGNVIRVVEFDDSREAVAA